MKQTYILHSTMESEFLTLAATSKEAEWLRNSLINIDLWPQPMSTISISCDSEATMSRALNKINNGKPRHSGLRHAYVRQLLSRVITITYVRFCKNLSQTETWSWHHVWKLKLP